VTNNNNNNDNKRNWKTKHVQRPGVLSQQDAKSGDKIVPVIIRALGTIKKVLDKNLQLLPGRPSAIELQKVTLMSTAKCWGKSL
jgi:hypothetical protein